MKKLLIGVLAFSCQAGFAQDATKILDAATKAMGIGNLTSIEYKGSGSEFNFGQAVNLTSPYPTFILKTYVVDIYYATPARREEMYRTEPDGSIPRSGFTQIELVSGSDAWKRKGKPPAPVAAAATVAERQLAIWMTPAGFIKGALANHATVKGKVVTFTTPDHHKVVGTLDAQNMVVKTRTWIDNPVLGDMLVESTFADYKDYGGVKFPGRIVESEGGRPTLDLTVSEVKPNGAAAIEVPDKVKGAKVPPITVTTQKVGNGLWYLTGGSHHSLVAEFNGHIVVIERRWTTRARSL